MSICQDSSRHVHESNWLLENFLIFTEINKGEVIDDFSKGPFYHDTNFSHPCIEFSLYRSYVSCGKWPLDNTTFAIGRVTINTKSPAHLCSWQGQQLLRNGRLCKHPRIMSSARVRAMEELDDAIWGCQRLILKAMDPVKDKRDQGG